MKVKFSEHRPYDSLQIIAENREEAEELSHWDYCTLSANFDYNYNEHPSNSILLITRRKP